MNDRFQTYSSNTSAGTTNSYMLLLDKPKRFFCRCYLKALHCGDFSWRFWFCNAVNSTFADGSVSWANRPGGRFRIHSAAIADGGTEIGAPLSSVTPVLFDGKPVKEVLPEERFWSDAVRFTLPQDHFLVWEWELEGDEIPCSTEAPVSCFSDYGNGFLPDAVCPKPSFVGIERPTLRHVVFCGDSITQGVGTTKDGYHSWAARVASALCDRYSFWNLGLGYGRCKDFASGKVWMEEATHADIAIVCYGVNDIFQRSGLTADELENDYRTILSGLQSTGCEVILFTIPPFGFAGEKERLWREVNRRIPLLAKEYGCKWFDFGVGLTPPAPKDNLCLYGNHPDDEGCAVVARHFLETGLL